MYIQGYYFKLIEELATNIDKKNGNILFVKQTGDIELNESRIRVVQFDVPVEILCCQFDTCYMQDAYEPFLKWLKFLFEKYYSEELSVEEFVEQCNIYKLRKEYFILYLKNGWAGRKIEMMINEADYEVHRIKRSIINAYEFVSRKIRLIFILNRLHYGAHSCIDLLGDFIKLSKFRSIACLGIYDEMNYKNVNLNQAWKKLLENIDNNNYGIVSEERENDSEKKQEFNPVVSDMKLYRDKIHNMIQFAAFHQISIYLDIIFKKIILELPDIDEDVKFDILTLGSIAKIIIREENTAILIGSHIRDNFDLSKNARWEFMFHYMMALANVYSAKKEVAMRHSGICREIANRSNEMRYVLMADVVQCYVDFYGWKYILGDSEISENQEVIERISKAGYELVLGYIYVYTYKNDPEFNLYDAKFKYIVPKLLQRAIDIALEYDDEMLLSLAYTKKAEICSSVSNFEYVDSIYKECFAIYEKYGEKRLMAQTYLSVGYNLMIVEQHEHSNEYFNAALEILYGEKDIERIGETLYNMGMNCLLTLDIENGQRFFINSYKISEIIGINGYAVCKMSKLFGLIALSSFYLERDFETQYFIDKAERILMPLLSKKDGTCQFIKECLYWEEDIFLFYFVKGLLAKKEKNYTLAESEMKCAKVFSDKSHNFVYFAVPWLAYEMSDLYKKMGDKKRSEGIIEEALKLLEKYNLNLKKMVLTSDMTESYRDIYKKSELTKISIEQIIELARYSSLINRYESEKTYIEFMYSWQNIFNLSTKGREDIVANNLATIKNSFSFDGVLCFRRKGNINECIYYDGDTEFDTINIEVLMEFISKSKKDFVVSQTEKVSNQYLEIINAFGKSNLISVLGVHFEGDSTEYFLFAYCNIFGIFTHNKVVITEKVLKVIRILLFQFGDALEIYESENEIEDANRRLKEMATKDFLTGLYNRQGFLSKVQGMNIAKGGTNYMLYFDLDNFKKYNDKYGHDIGDWILIGFSKVLKSQIKDGDFAIRYGGDEFIMILENKDMDHVKMVVEQVRNVVNDKIHTYVDSQMEEKSQLFDKEVICCSIGVTQFDHNDKKSVEEAIKFADKALYQAKKTNKGGYFIV